MHPAWQPADETSGVGSRPCLPTQLTPATPPATPPATLPSALPDAASQLAGHAAGQPRPPATSAGQSEPDTSVGEEQCSLLLLILELFCV